MEMRKVYDDGIRRIGFKKEISELELYGIEGVINKLYDDEILDYSADSLGLAYTSSSGYGMYNVCDEVYHDELEISHFAVLNDGRLVMVARDSVTSDVYYLID